MSIVMKGTASPAMSPELRAAAEAQRLGRSSQARALAAEWLKQHPDDLLALAILAAAAIDLRFPAEAEAILRRVLQRAPAFTQASMELARSLEAQSRLTEAISVVDEVVGRDPDSVPANTFLAHLHSKSGRFDRAAALYEHLVELHPDDPNLWVGYADLLRYLGRPKDSETAFRRALALAPDSGLAWWGLSNLDAASLSDTDIDLMRAALTQPGNAPDSELLHFALGNAFDRRGESEQAFAHYRRANQAHRQAHPYEAAELSGEVDRSIALLNRPFFERRKGFGMADPSPVFIVGMPRSGSTLLERMLGQHSQVEAVGELPILPRMVNMLTAEPSLSGRPYPDLLEGLSAERIRELGETYLGRAREFRKSQKPLFTDKLHMNWRHLGLIHLMLPRARVIDMRRGALDCCWSNFKLNFTRGHLASNDLGDLGQFYADYVRMLDHMEAVAPGMILEVRYEDFIDDPAGQLERVLAFLGLDFEQRCLDFHLATEPVATASSEQVRKPLYRSGIGAWRRYEPWLGELIASLGPLAGDHS